MTINTISNDNKVFVFELCSEFFDPRDLGRCECVCQSLNALAKLPNFWLNLFTRHIISLVEGHDTTDATVLKNDFRVLHPLFISGRRISRFFGEVVGKPGNIRKELFNRLNDPDPFDPTNLLKDTFVFVVDPYLIKRANASFLKPSYVDTDGHLEILRKEMKGANELMIPFTLSNQITLSKVPLEKGCGPSAFKWGYQRFINQCGCPNKVNVYFMRKHAVKESFNMTYPEGETFVRAKGYEVSPVRLRSIFNVIQIFESGTCPDKENGEKRYTLARCSDIVTSRVGHAHIIDRPLIGSYRREERIGENFDIWPGGLTIDSCGDNVVGKGIAPCILAEVAVPPNTESFSTKDENNNGRITPL